MNNTGKKIIKGVSRFIFGYITVAIMILLIIADVWYLNTMRESLWKNFALNALELTKQGANSFESKLDNEVLSVRTLSGFLHSISSTDAIEIQNTLLQHNVEENTELNVFNMENCDVYTTVKTKMQTMSDKQVAELGTYKENGWVEAFYSPYDGKQYIGYYEKFQFADGVEGIIRKNIATKNLGEDYSLSFYNGQGYSYIVDKDGNIIVRAQDKHSNRTLSNIFDVIRAGSNSEESLTSFENAILEQKNGVMSFDFEDESFIFAFNTISGTNSWSFISLIPETALSAHLDSIMRTSSVVIVLLVIMIIIAIMFIFNKKLARKETALQDALVSAQAANRAKTTFLNNMSHDIRTPMNAIVGYTVLATKHIDNPEYLKDYLGKITQSSSHLLALINDVLDMSRIESGKVNINEKEESLSEILHSIRDIVQADIHAKHLNLFLDTVDLVDENIYCDKLRLNQVLLNILSNAIKYTLPGGYISLRISELKTSASGYATYEFRIKDNGIGMSEDFAKTVFEPFTRERTSTVSGIQGTGLGMAITKNIVDMMGGTITCESKENEGTEFVVAFDFRLQTDHKEIEKIVEIDNLRGLVVDDDMNACQSTAQILRQVGMRSEWCTLGTEAIVRTQEAVRIGDRFEVYIIDWKLPDINGIEVARKIRSIVGDDAPIIILTAYDWTDIKEEAKEAGVTDFISKPLFPSDLKMVLMRACGQIAAPSEKEKQKIDLSQKRILLVEDNEFNREIAAEILGEAGLIIEEAEDGSEAVNKLLEKGAGYYDLVLMDIQMPIMDGYTAARTIRNFENRELANVPIVALSANAFEEDKKKSLEAGMNDHITKPIDVNKIMDILEKIME